MCKFLIFNTQKRHEKQKNFGNFSATFWKLLDTFIGNFFGIQRHLVARPTSEASRQYNVLELGAAFFALKSFGNTITGAHIQLRLDNTTAVAYNLLTTWLVQNL